MPEITSRLFDVCSDGTEVTAYTLKNSGGMSAEILDYGGIVRALRVKTPSGEPCDVVLGFDSMAGYEADTCFLGAFVGRYANRIKAARFELDGTEYILPANDGKNHLHGVMTRAMFDVREKDSGLELSYLSPDGEEGFPGNLSVRVRYELTEENELIMDYTAETDAPTVVNLTNHSYFNLNGCDSGNILSHELKLGSDYFTEGDAETLPTGRILAVAGTPMDFTEPKAVGRDIYSDYTQLLLCRGYDHNFILRGENGVMKSAATLRGDKSGIVMECLTTQPAIQLYTGNFLTGTGKNGTEYGAYSALCLETQHYPCSPNFPEFPSTVLRPGEQYRRTTVYRFGK